MRWQTPGVEPDASEIRLYAAIDDVLSFVDQIIPDRLHLTEETMGDIFGCAAVQRLADLLRVETLLARSGDGATSRVIGRAAIEAWLWAVYFFLAPADALERLIRESQGHDRRQLVGVNRLWERVEALQKSGLSPPEAAPPRTGTADPNVRELAELTADVRRGRGFDGGRADGAYHNRYRWDSTRDVHPSLDLFMRYFDLDAEQAAILTTARPEEADELRGVGGAFETSLLLLDSLGVYSQLRGITVPRALHERMTEIAELEHGAEP